MSAQDGFRFSTKDYRELACCMSKAFDAFEGWARQHVTAFIVSTAVDLADTAWWSRTQNQLPLPHVPFDDHLKAATDIWWGRFSESQKNLERNALVDGAIEVICWPGPDGHFYGQARSAVPGIREFLLEQGWAEDFAYSGRSEPAQGLTEKDWQYRQYVWEEVYKGLWGRASSFKTLPLCRYPVHPASVRQCMPSPQHRARPLVRKWLFRQWLSQGCWQGPPGKLSTLQDEFSTELKQHAGPWARRYHDEVVRVTALLPALELGV